MRMMSGAMMDRPRALTLAAARREIRAQIGTYSTKRLWREVRVKHYQLTCTDVRPLNILRCDLHELRMLRNELLRRGEDIFPAFPAGGDPRF